MTPYMGPTDKDAFKDLEKQPKSKAAWMYKNLVQCPQCQGYGGWNLRLDAYGPGKHFKAYCSHCMGWGWVEAGSKDETCCPHDMVLTRNLGNCYNEYKCSKCGKVKTVDSSD